MNEGLSQIMRDTSVGGCADASSVGTGDRSVTESQSEPGGIEPFFEKPKPKTKGFFKPYIRSTSLSTDGAGGDGDGGKILQLPLVANVSHTKTARRKKHKVVHSKNNSSLLNSKRKSGSTEGLGGDGIDGVEWTFTHPESSSRRNKKGSKQLRKPKVPESGRKRLCGKCAEAGRECKLRLYQLNINEAILMCENAKCSFSLSTSYVVTRDFGSVKRLRHKLPVAFRSLPSSPAASQSSSSSCVGTEPGCSRSSSPLSQTASDSCLVRCSRVSADIRLPVESAGSYARNDRFANAFYPYECQRTQDLTSASESDDLSTLLAEIGDVVIVCDSVHAEPGQFSNAFDDLMDMEWEDDFVVPLDKGDNLGGGPARGQQGEKGSGDALANGSDQGLNSVIQQHQGEKLLSLHDPAHSMEQAVSSSTASYEGIEMEQHHYDTGDTNTQINPSESSEPRPSYSEGEAEMTKQYAVAEGSSYTQPTTADPCTSSQNIYMETDMPASEEGYIAHHSSITEYEEGVVQYPTESGDHLQETVYSGGQKVDSSSHQSSVIGGSDVESSTRYDGSSVEYRSHSEDAVLETGTEEMGEEGSGEVDTVTTTVQSGLPERADYSAEALDSTSQPHYYPGEASYTTEDQAAVAEESIDLQDPASLETEVDVPSGSEPQYVDTSDVDRSSQLAAEILSNMPTRVVPHTSQHTFPQYPGQYSEEAMDISQGVEMTQSYPHEDSSHNYSEAVSQDAEHAVETDSRVSGDTEEVTSSGFHSSDPSDRDPCAYAEDSNSMDMESQDMPLAAAASELANNEKTAHSEEHPMPAGEQTETDQTYEYTQPDYQGAEENSQAGEQVESYQSEHANQYGVSQVQEYQTEEQAQSDADSTDQTRYDQSQYAMVQSSEGAIQEEGVAHHQQYVMESGEAVQYQVHPSDYQANQYLDGQGEYHVPQDQEQQYQVVQSTEATPQEQEYQVVQTSDHDHNQAQQYHHQVVQEHQEYEMVQSTEHPKQEYQVQSTADPEQEYHVESSEQEQEYQLVQPTEHPEQEYQAVEHPEEEFQVVQSAGLEYQSETAMDPGSYQEMQAAGEQQEYHQEVQSAEEAQYQEFQSSEHVESSTTNYQTVPQQHDEEGQESFQPEYMDSEEQSQQHAEQQFVGEAESEEMAHHEVTATICRQQAVTTPEHFQVVAGDQLEEQQVEMSEEVVGDSSVDNSVHAADMLATASEIAGVTSSETAGGDGLGSQETEPGSDSESEEFVPVAIETRRVAALESEKETEGVTSSMEHMAVRESGEDQEVLTMPMQAEESAHSQEEAAAVPQKEEAEVQSQIRLITAQGQTIRTIPASVLQQIQQASGGHIFAGSSVAAILQRHLAQQQGGTSTATILQPKQSLLLPHQGTSLLQPAQTTSLLPGTSLPQGTSLLQSQSLLQQQGSAAAVLQAASCHLKQAQSLLPQKQTSVTTPSITTPTQPQTLQQQQQQPPPIEPPLPRILQDVEATAVGNQVVNLFVQWQNVDALCWLDVLLCPLVHSPTLTALLTPDRLRELDGTILNTLVKAYRQAQGMLEALLNRSGQQESQPAGPGGTPYGIINKANIADIGQAIGVLYTARETIWKTMQPRLRCEKGKHDSPVFAMPLLVRENPEMKRIFTMKYRLVFACQVCGYTQDDKHHKIMPSLPAVPNDFSMEEPCFVRPCFQCQAPEQRMRMIFEDVQDFFLLHFVNGMPHNRFHELDFSFGDSDYTVTSVVQYKRNPDHFISWIRNAPDHAWMECDDLKSVLTRFTPGQPCIPPSQVHIVMWERNVTAAHARCFLNTPHTNLLASLVLTVQYPSSAPATATSSATGATSTTSSGAVGSAVTPPPHVQHVMYPPAPHGRSRGRGRGRGRGQSSTTSSIIRRPGVSNTTTTTGTKQVIYTMGAPGLTAQAPSQTGSQRIVVVKSPTGVLQAVNPASLSPAILELLKKQGLNVGSLNRTIMVPQGSVSQTVPFTSLLAKPSTTIAMVTSESENTQSSEASEAVASLVSSMQNEGISTPSIVSSPSSTTTTSLFPTSAVTVQNLTSSPASAGQFQTTPGMTSLLTSSVTSLLLPGKVLMSSASSSGDKPQSMLGTVLASADPQQPLVVGQITSSEGQPLLVRQVSGDGSVGVSQPMVVKQITPTTSGARVAGSPSPIIRLMSSAGAKTIQVRPVGTSTQGRRLVMVAQPSSSRGINIVHPAPTLSSPTATGPVKYQLMTKTDGTRILTQIAPAPSPTSPPLPGTSSVRVALEGGDGGTRLVSISSPSCSTTVSDVLSFNSAPGNSTSMVGTPLLEARSSNIRTSIVDSILPGNATTATTTAANPIVISPTPGGSPESKPATAVSLSKSSMDISSPTAGSAASAGSDSAPLLDIRHHLSYRSEPVPGSAPETSVMKDQETEEEGLSDNEADLDLDNWKQTKASPRGSRRGRGCGRGRVRGRGRARGRGGRGRVLLMSKIAPGLGNQDEMMPNPTVVRSVSVSESGGLPPATFPSTELTSGDSQDNTDSSSSLLHETPVSEVASEESVDMEMGEEGSPGLNFDESSQKSNRAVTSSVSVSVVTEAVQSIELGAAGSGLYASAQAEQEQLSGQSYEEVQDMTMEVVEQEVVTSDLQVMQEEVTVGEEDLGDTDSMPMQSPSDTMIDVQSHIEETVNTQSPKRVEDSVGATEDVVPGRRGGRRRGSVAQTPRRSRKTSGSSSQSPRGRRRWSGSVDDTSLSQGSESEITGAWEGSALKSSSPLSSPFTSPVRGSPQKSPVASPSGSPFKFPAVSVEGDSPQVSPAQSPAKSSPCKSPYSSPARKSPYTSPTRSSRSPHGSPTRTPAKSPHSAIRSPGDFTALQDSPQVIETVEEKIRESEVNSEDKDLPPVQEEEDMLEESVSDTVMEVPAQEPERVIQPPKKRGRKRQTPHSGQKKRDIKDIVIHEPTERTISIPSPLKSAGVVQTTTEGMNQSASYIEASSPSVLPASDKPSDAMESTEDGAVEEGVEEALSMTLSEANQVIEPTEDYTGQETDLVPRYEEADSRDLTKAAASDGESAEEATPVASKGRKQRSRSRKGRARKALSADKSQKMLASKVVESAEPDMSSVEKKEEENMGMQVDTLQATVFEDASMQQGEESTSAVHEEPVLGPVVETDAAESEPALPVTPVSGKKRLGRPPKKKTVAEPELTDTTSTENAQQTTSGTPADNDSFVVTEEVENSTEMAAVNSRTPEMTTVTAIHGRVSKAADRISSPKSLSPISPIRRKKGKAMLEKTTQEDELAVSAEVQYSTPLGPVETAQDAHEEAVCGAAKLVSVSDTEPSTSTSPAPVSCLAKQKRGRPPKKGRRPKEKEQGVEETAAGISEGDLSQTENLLAEESESTLAEQREAVVQQEVETMDTEVSAVVIEEQTPVSLDDGELAQKDAQAVNNTSLSLSNETLAETEQSTSEVLTVPKRKRGRPPKNSYNLIRKEEKDACTQPETVSYVGVEPEERKKESVEPEEVSKLDTREEIVSNSLQGVNDSVQWLDEKRGSITPVGASLIDSVRTPLEEGVTSPTPARKKRGRPPKKDSKENTSERVESVTSDNNLQGNKSEQILPEEESGKLVAGAVQSLNNTPVSSGKEQRSRRRKSLDQANRSASSENGLDVAASKRQRFSEKGEYMSASKRKTGVISKTVNPSPLKTPNRTVVHNPGEGSQGTRSNRDNIFDIMNEVSPTYKVRQTERMSNKVRSPKSKKGKESPSISRSLAVKARMSPSSPEQPAVVKRRGSYPFHRRNPSLSTGFATPSSENEMRQKPGYVRSRSISQGAVVIRRRPRPLASPDIQAPPLASHISPVRRLVQTDYSNGYCSVLVTRRKPADWSCSFDQTEQEHSADWSCSFDQTEQEHSQSELFSRVHVSESSTTTVGDLGRHSNNTGPSVPGSSAAQITCATTNVSVSSHVEDVSASFRVSEESSASASADSLMVVEMSASEQLTKASQSGKESRTKGHSKQLGNVKIVEDISDSAMNQNELGPSFSVGTQGSVTDNEDQSVTTPIPSSQSDEPLSPSSPAKNEALSSSIRRSSRPVMPSQRMKESDILKRRLSGNDTSSEPSPKKYRTMV